MNRLKAKVWGSFYATIPSACRCADSSPSVCSPAVEPAASVCVCAAASFPSAALPAAERSPAAAESTRDGAELNHIDRALSKSQICIPSVWLCWCVDRFKCADAIRIILVCSWWSTEESCKQIMQVWHVSFYNVVSKSLRYILHQNVFFLRCDEYVSVGHTSHPHLNL